MPNVEYEHAYIAHTHPSGENGAAIPLTTAEGLNAWGADGWEVVHMEAVWQWHRDAEGKSWPEALLGYYVTFRREADGTGGARVMVAEAELSVEEMRSLNELAHAHGLPEHPVAETATE